MVLELVTPRVVIISRLVYIPLTNVIGYYHQSQLHTACAASPVPVIKEQTSC